MRAEAMGPRNEGEWLAVAMSEFWRARNTWVLLAIAGLTGGVALLVGLTPTRPDDAYARRGVVEMGATAGASLLLLGVQLLLARRRARRDARGQRDRVRYLFEDDAVAFTIDGATTRQRWGTVRAVALRRRVYWLLTDAGDVPIPAAGFASKADEESFRSIVKARFGRKARIGA